MKHLAINRFGCRFGCDLLAGRDTLDSADTGNVTGTPDGAVHAVPSGPIHTARKDVAMHSSATHSWMMHSWIVFAAFGAALALSGCAGPSTGAYQAGSDGIYDEGGLYQRGLNEGGIDEPGLLTGGDGRIDDESL
ncbi:MAG TPA: hypothetical protein VD995_09685 [Azospirillum sp.]|nr:hypothetical protein [Azospirillum sp.]